MSKYTGMYIHIGSNVPHRIVNIGTIEELEFEFDFPVDDLEQDVHYYFFGVDPDA